MIDIIKGSALHSLKSHESYLFSLVNGRPSVNDLTFRSNNSFKYANLVTGEISGLRNLKGYRTCISRCARERERGGRVAMAMETMRVPGW